MSQSARIDRPSSPLNDSAPTVAGPTGTAPSADEPILQVQNLAMRFPIRGRRLFSRQVGWVHAVNDVTLDLRPGEVLGLVGESGCGKTTLGRCIARSEAPTEGHIYYRTALSKVVDLAGMSTAELRPYQREVRVIFQDPFSSLNPRMTILQIVGDPLQATGLARGSELEDRVASNAPARRAVAGPHAIATRMHSQVVSASGSTSLEH